MTASAHIQSPDWQDKETLKPQFDIIRAARALVKAHSNPIQEQSQADYDRRLETMLRQIEALPAARLANKMEAFLSFHAPAGRTFYKYRAILCRHLAMGLKERLKQQDQFQKMGLFELWQRSVESLDEELKTLQKIHQLHQKILVKQSGQKNKPSRTKKEQKLPNGWADTLLEQSIDHRFYKAILVLCVTGCRPSELSDAQFSYSQEKVYVEIKGKKVTSANGQSLRSFIIPAKKLPQHFIDELKKNSQLQVPEVATDNEQKSLRMYLNRLGAKEFPDLEQKISPISFRHTMASTLRDEGWEKGEIAKVMGHASERTQGHYGARKRRRGKRPAAPIEKGSAEASRPVRKKKSAFLSEHPPVLENKRAVKHKANPMP